MSRFVLTAQLQLQAPSNVRQVVQQIQSQLNGVTVNLQVQNAAQSQRQIQQVAQATNQATTAAERMGKAFALSIRRFAAFSIATRAVGLFTSTLSDAVQTSIDFERQLIKIAQVTGKSVGQLRGLTKEITSLSTGFGVASSDLLEVSTILAQAGLSADDTSTALRTLAKAALAPNFDSISETAEGAIAILAQFQEGVGALEKQLGSINAVAGAFAVEASDLIDVIRRTGGVFKASGGDLNELLALFTSVRATTRESAESIGTGLRTIFTRIQRPKTIEFLKQFGVELVDLDGKFVGPYEAIKRLSGALAGLGEGDISFIRIAEELGGFRQIGKVLPLLQQFSTAQSALNVAMKAGDSLTQDAASAQAALAIRIMKVKEEFLALIRSVTETSTFQIMANTALSLASALIKIGDAIKPLLPMLGALAAIKLAKGMSSFFGGMMSGAASGRAYNKGGKVLGFARGGLVPGTGNRDTVPAMLSPGEFVIRKSSVNKMGAGTLAAMNENRYATGGVAEKIAAARNQSGLLPKKQSRDLKSIAIKTPQFGKESEVGIATTSYLPSPAKTNITIDRESIADQSIGDLGFKLSTKYGKNALSYIKQVYKGKPNLSYNAVAEGVGLDEEKQFKTIIDESIGSAVDIASQRFATEILGSSLSKPVPKLQSFYNTLDGGFRGQLFENVITAMSGKPLSGQDSRRPFDFTRGIGKFKSIYSNLGMNYVDAKISSGAAGVGVKGFGTDGVTGLKTKILSQLAKEAIPAISLIERQAGETGTLTTQGKKAKKHFGGIIQKFATGGGVGTDTVPALLTPGEFVVNRSSAQRIGYGNLNRMNKVGKYAKGGVVQHFAAGSSGPITSSGGGTQVYYTTAQQAATLGNACQSASTQIIKSNNDQKKSIVDVINNNKLFAASMSVSLIQGFLPAVDENSSAMTRLTQSLLGLVTAVTSVGASLQAFGLNLNKQMAMDFLKGGGIKNLTGKLGLDRMAIGQRAKYLQSLKGGDMDRFAALKQATAESKAGFGFTGKGVTPFTKFLGNSVNILAKFGGVLTSVVGSAYLVTEAFKSSIDAIYNFDGRLKSAIESGNINEAKSVANERATFQGANVVRGGGATAGAIVGMILGGPIGAAIGAGIGASVGTLVANLLPESALDTLNVMFGGNTRNSAVALAAAQAGAVKTQKDLDKAQKVATDAMSEFEKGSISAAEALAKIRSATSEVVNQEKRASDFATSNLENRAGGISGFGRNVLSAITLGGVESVDQRNRRLGKESAEQIRQASQFQAQAFQLETPARSATIRSALFANQSPDQIRKQLNVSGGRDSLQARAEAMRDKEVKLLTAGDKEGAKAAADAAMVLEEQIEIIDKELVNLAQEVKTAKEKFAALNLGFRSITSASDAAALKMDNLMSSFEAGNLPAARAAATLEAAMTSAGQNIKKVDFDSALNEVNGVFKAFGASQEQIDKFNGLLQGVAGVQREFPTIFETLKKELMSGELKDINNPTEVGKKFKDIVGAQLKASGIDEAAREQILAAMGDVKLDPQDVSKILAGDYSVLEKYLGEAGEEVKKNMKAVIDNYIKVNQQLIEATKKRIDAERNLVEAQKEALDLIMEGREIQAKYGGREVTNEERRQNLLAKSNVEGSRLGLSNMKSGNVPELRRRNLEIMGGFANVEDGRRRNGLAGGARGVESDEFQKDLQKAYKTQIETIRSLIKLEEDQLKITEEKNKLEKESLESLVKGDIESFFKQQAAVGARAAIASGDQRSMNLYGSEALGAAALDIQRQKDAGVQSLYGQRLGGAGGLAEAAAAAALSSMGVTDMRSAQVMAGTTGEEEAIKARLRELGGLLGETGQIGVQMAEMQVGTATIQADKAQLIVNNLATGGNPPVQKRANGGLIYASRGMFVPRGSDTVPAMLTPGEFVVSRSAVQRGNNLQILSAMNGGSSSPSSTQSESVKMSRGGIVKYFDNGGKVEANESNPMGSFDNQIMNKFAESLSSFNRNLTLNIDKLKQTSINIKLDSTNVNVNLNDGGLLKALKEEVKKELLTVISNQFKLDNNGNIRRNQTVLG